MKKNKKNEENNTDSSILVIILSILLVCFLTAGLIFSFKSRFYKETEATLLSFKERDVDAEDGEYYEGNYEYFVNGRKYDATISIKYYECHIGYTKTIYYNPNKPESYVEEKASIFSMVVFGIIDIVLIAATCCTIIDHKNEKKKKINKLKKQVF